MRLVIYIVEQKLGAGYDEVEAFVVAARDATQARRIASEKHQDEGREVWLDSDKTRVRNIGTGFHKEPAILLKSVRSG